MHWSYSEKAEGDLVQGDILLPSKALAAALESVHRWFADPKYLGFIVISQTCDLVRRQGLSCKTPYVEIAVIRPLQAYLLSLLRQQCDWIGDRYFPASERNRASDLLDRVINQNESSLGLFYLHPESAIGIAEECVALLRVSIAMRTAEHYETLIESRRGRLHPEFANKLGWLCGNLYSRVGIRDWKETSEDQKKASAIIKRFLDGSQSQGPKFVECPRSFRKGLEDGSINLKNCTAQEIEVEISRHSGTAYKALAIDAISRILEAEGIDATAVTRIKRNLGNDPAFTNSVKQGIG